MIGMQVQIGADFYPCIMSHISEHQLPAGIFAGRQKVYSTEILQLHALLHMQNEASCFMSSADAGIDQCMAFVGRRTKELCERL